METFLTFFTTITFIHILICLLCGFMGAVIFYILRFKLYKIGDEIVLLFTDTLKIKGSYSRTSITMFVSFLMASFYSMFDLFKSGQFKFEVFIVYMCVATGIKITDAVSKKMLGRTYNGEKEVAEIDEKTNNSDNSTL